jgi:hypothetical protein
MSGVNANVDREKSGPFGKPWALSTAVAQGSENPQLQLQSSPQREPGGIETSEFLFCFFEHSEIDIALDRLQTSQVLGVFRRDRFDDDPSHNDSTTFDEMNYPVVQHIDDVEAPVSGAMPKSAADTAASTVS